VSAVDDAGDPADGNLDLPRKLGCGEANFGQLFGEMFTGVDGGGTSVEPLQ
jgi:hypothetical protein